MREAPRTVAARLQGATRQRPVGGDPDRRGSREGSPPAGCSGMNDTPIVVTVYGAPVPQGSKRHVGGGRMVESSPHLPTWRNAVVDACRGQLETRMPLDGPLVLHAHFTVAKPQSAPKRRRTWPAKKPDVDKLLRAVMDAITAAGVWRDDAQVIDARATKSYPNETADALDVPGVRFTVIPMESQ